MATAARTGSGKPTSPLGAPAAAPGAPRPSLGDRLVGWAKAHQKITSWTGAILLVGAGLFLWTLSTQRRTEEIAIRDLHGARYAFENQNLPLPPPALATSTSNYPHTNPPA